MQFNFLKQFKPKTNFLGVDIGTTSIKMVELSKAQGAPRLVDYAILETYGHLDRLNSAIQTSSLKMVSDQTSGLLKIMVESMDTDTKDVVASIPAFSALTALIEMPVMSGQDTSKAMQFQVKQYIPLPISSVTIDWIKIGERKNDQGTNVQQILLVSIPNENIERYKEIFKGAGLNLTALEIEGISEARSLTTNDNKNTLIIDIGSRSTMIAVAQNGVLKSVGQTDFAGGSLTQTISAGLNIKTRRAEDLKKLRGLKGTGGEYELSTLMLPILDVIINEARRVMNNYETKYEENIERVVLSGGGANLLGIIPYIQEQFNLPTTKADPFSKVTYPSDIEPLVSELSTKFSVAIGLGIKPFQQ